ncbi:MAG TPA: ATP-dependent DNA ligase [Gemmatimonadales bacterium]|nr:ATP-dependent DNA ligase [Gemmatimonadales bacterium]
MSLPLRYPFPPMEAESVAMLPAGSEWQYEPKWDGFRCLAFRDGGTVRLQSKAGKPLGRYFPDVVEAVAALEARRCVLDGEIVIPVDGRLSFDELLLRIHPAESRVRTLVEAHRARIVVFDLLVDERGRSLVALALAERRERLEAFAKRQFPRDGSIVLSQASRRVGTAKDWLAGGTGDLDGVVAKRLDLPYRSGERDGMVKVKRRRTADCVVGGYRYASKGGGIGSLLLGLYDDEGRLDHVGFCSSLPASERVGLKDKLERLRKPPGFTGRAPGGPSRWSTERSAEWEPLAPKLVVEVEYDHVSSGRFRHGTRFVRWRPDKAPRQCTMEQLR